MKLFDALFGPAADQIPGGDMWERLANGKPLDDRPDWFNRMSRSARFVNRDVLEIRTFFDMRIRTFLFPIIVAIVAVIGINSLLNDEYLFAPIVEDVRRLVDYEGFLREQYENTGWSTPFEEYYAGFTMEGQHKRHAWETVAFITLIFGGPLSVVLLWPRRHAYRLDRRRGIIYGIIKGELCVARLYDDAGNTALQTRIASSPPMTFRMIQKSTLYGPLLTAMIGIKSGKKRIGWMGVQPVTHASQNADLQLLLDIFISPHIPPEAWMGFLRRRGFLMTDLLRAIDLISLRRAPNLDHPKIQAQLDAYLPRAVVTGDIR